MLQGHRTSERATQHKHSQSLCASKERSRTASRKHSDTHVDKERGQQIRSLHKSASMLLLLGSVGNCSRGGANTCSAFGDQNECCIGSVTETLKAMLDPGFKRPPALPRRQAGRFETEKVQYSLFFKPQKWCQSVLRYHSTTGTFIFNLRLIISLWTKQHIH